ncbi:MAG TPA: sulfotransferase [Fimbriimonas sp.]|nr:sulfotransferase [Fimbriimonas sp.]
MATDEIKRLAASAQSALIAGRLEEAQELSQEILRLDPRFSPAEFFLAMVAVRQGRPDEAISILQKLLSSNPNAFQPIAWLAALFRDQGRQTEAIALCERMIQLKPELADGHSTMGLCLFDRGRVQGALPYLQRAAALSPQSAASRQNLGSAYEELSMLGEAAAEFEAASELEPMAAASHAALGRVRLNGGNPTGSVEPLEAAVRLAPTADNLMMLAGSLAAAGQYERSELFLRRVIAARPEDAAAHVALGYALQILGRFDEAAHAFDEAISLDPDMADPYFGLSRCRRFTQEDEPVLARLEAMAHDQDRNHKELRKLHYTLAHAYDQLDRYEAALRHFDLANRFSHATQLGGVPFDVSFNDQWLDRLVEFFGEGSFDAQGGSQSERPLLIVGMIRSGTTLTEQILSSHRDVGAGGELKFWTSQEQAGLQERLMRATARPEELSQAIDAYLQLLSELAPGAPRVTDKMPQNYAMLGLAHTLFPRAKIIHCRRDPLDTCLSIYFTPFDKGAGFFYDRKSIVAGYMQYLRVMRHWRKVLPAETLLEISYEELVADREAVTRRMIEFCGLEWDDACLEHERNPREVLTPSRWQVRQPIYSSSVGRWKRYEPWLGEFRELLTATSQTQ